MNDVVVVTGGAGFIGSCAVDRLLERGDVRVIVLDNFSTGKRSNLKQWEGHSHLTIVETDVARDFETPLLPLVQSLGPVSRIIHLAAQTSVTHSLNSPLENMEVNYGATLRVMEYARQHKVRKVVFASSAAVYGDTERVPVQESFHCHPLSPYGLHKLVSEQCMRCYAAVHGVPSTAFRFFNVYGPRQDPKSPYSGVISIFIAKALAGETLTIFGDGKQTRDFVFVSDIADALLKACFNDQNNGFEVMNLGTGVEVSVTDLAHMILDEAQASKSDLAYADARAGEILRSCADIERAQNLLAYHPKVKLRAGLADTMQWYRDEGESIDAP